jgi:hypothetical protein
MVNAGQTVASPRTKERATMIDFTNGITANKEIRVQPSAAEAPMTCKSLAKRYGDYHRQWSRIEAMLTELISRHDAMQALNECSERPEEPSNWCGLTRIDRKVLDENTSTEKRIYLFDDDLCWILKLPLGSTCYAIWVDSRVVMIVFEGNRHTAYSSREMAEVKRWLTKVKSVMLIKGDAALCYC